MIEVTTPKEEKIDVTTGAPDVEEDPRKAKLRALRAQIAEAEAEEQERIEDLETKMLEVVIEAQKKHGKDGVRGLVGRRGFIVVTTPHPATFRKYSDLDNQTTEDMYSLLKPCVYPPGAWDEVEKLLNKETGLLLPACSMVVDLAGVKPRAISGKSKS